ncbi:Os01g0903401 [Oryza sativa Japonica Group]|uniref:Os01g0903401 protein n=1 Tax=Oryza sativa subsp. japonica TaxID=39947 RepID=A0A0P0VBV4_ORYSJ|nr:Os01g0903401 [Oryza sativa Japonica Group]
MVWSTELSAPRLSFTTEWSSRTLLMATASSASTPRSSMWRLSRPRLIPLNSRYIPNPSAYASRTTTAGCRTPCSQGPAPADARRSRSSCTKNDATRWNARRAGLQRCRLHAVLARRHRLSAGDQKLREPHPVSSSPPPPASRPPPPSPPTP